ncbi:hypothetical protein Q1695_003525 [Nippostrongylus brasiliensis]|nr:hypothetical protein Q1695_003525 [Nippostrongylus brasiliensis]
MADEMKTVKFKKPAILASLAVVFIILCVISYFSSSPSSDHPHLVKAIRPARFAFAKHGAVEAEKPAPIRRLNRSENDNEPRKKKVVEMMLHAWNGYKNYSWGANELRPESKAPHTAGIFGGEKMPATIVDAADTLYIMGLTKEYEEARQYIKDNFDMSKATGTLSVFETTIRFLGGLLSLYALTKEQFYMDKARSVGEALLPAFNTPTGIPTGGLNMQSKGGGRMFGGNAVLAELGSLHLEFMYLSQITGSPIFGKKVRKVRNALDKVEKPSGLYYNFINADTGKWTSNKHISLGALGDSFYEYLIKSWLQSNKKDQQARRMYWEASDALRANIVFKSESGLTYVGELKDGVKESKMGHLACFSVGMFALQAVNEHNEQRKKSTMQLAEELGATCHESYIRSNTGIGPEMFYFDDSDDATSKSGENNYILRPEVIEGFFYLWRLTGKTKYREWVWDAISAIDKYCRVEAGFAGLVNVYDPKQGHDDVQQSFFLAETLKYAYLTFTDPSVIPLDQWVFNTEAHPLPVMDITV